MLVVGHSRRKERYLTFSQRDVAVVNKMAFGNFPKGCAVKPNTAKF
jgi:hypothetical protein